MMMEMFFNRFPDVAQKETRSIIISEKGPLPIGGYHMLESFCNDKQCDCRRAFINVEYNYEIVATIGFDWEDLKFYEKWAHNNQELAINMKGPILVITGISTKYSHNVLSLFKEYMMKDQGFLERLKRHYRMFKDAL